MRGALQAGEIHATAIVDPSAEIAADAVIGPYAVIGPRVVIGSGSRIGPHAVLHQDTRLGRDVQVHQGASLGNDPQDLKYAGEHSELIVGDRTVIREFCTVNRGTASHGKTEVGHDCLLMAYSHVAHDCVVGNHVVIANAVNMGGHVIVGDWVIIGGVSAVHQFVRIGAHAIVGGTSAVRKDIPPFVKASGNPLQLFGLNSVGLRRRGFTEELRLELKRAYRLFFQSELNVRQAMERAAAELRPFPEVQQFLSFIQASDRGISV